MTWSGLVHSITILYETKVHVLDNCADHYTELDLGPGWQREQSTHIASNATAFPSMEYYRCFLSRINGGGEERRGPAIKLSFIGTVSNTLGLFTQRSLFLIPASAEMALFQETL